MFVFTGSHTTLPNIYFHRFTNNLTILFFTPDHKKPYSLIFNKESHVTSLFSYNHENITNLTLCINEMKTHDRSVFIRLVFDQLSESLIFWFGVERGFESF